VYEGWVKTSLKNKNTTPMNTSPITVHTQVHAPLARVWEYYTVPEHVMQWNHASDDWHCPTATSDFSVGGRFVYTMAAKDGSESFDFGGTFEEIDPLRRIVYVIDGNRCATVTFTPMGDVVEVSVSFDPEDMNSHELQQTGWQAILDTFARVVEVGE
jgi:uncharacterized protein YndB with AHSA1/START domain